MENDPGPQIYDPSVGRRYRMFNGGRTFTGVVTAWTIDSVTVKIDREQDDGSTYPPCPVVLQRVETMFMEWV